MPTETIGNKGYHQGLRKLKPNEQTLEWNITCFAMKYFVFQGV